MDTTHRVTGEDGAGAALPSIRDVLRLPVVAESLPEVLAGGDRLDAPVRWVHITETASVANLLNGGELLLSTGVGWPQNDGELDDYVDELVRVGVSGLVLELGGRFPAAPERLVDQCRARGLPLIVLHLQARFVAITEAVHSRIIADQMTALRARDDIHALFTELSLHGSPADYIVAQVGRALRAPVVLENLTHQIVAAECQDAGETILLNWEQRSRAAHRSARHGGEQDWLIVPVEARGTRWGYLIALPGRQHAAGRSNVLEQAAVTLALSRLADRDDDEWIRQSHQYLLRALLGGRYSSEAGLVARFEATGMRVRDRRLFGASIAAGSATISSAALRTAAAEIGADVVAGADPAARPAQLLVALSLPQTQQLTDRAVGVFLHRLARDIGVDPQSIVLGVGDEARGLPGLLASIEEAAELLRHGQRTRGRGSNVHRAENRPLLRLINSFGGDPRLQAHSELMLRPLIEYDLENDGDLLDVLAAYVEHPGNRTQGAAASHLSRSVFYQRIALIESLTGVDLDDGETLSALHTALLARRRSAR